MTRLFNVDLKAPKHSGSTCILERDKMIEYTKTIRQRMGEQRGVYIHCEIIRVTKGSWEQLGMNYGY